MVQEMRYRTISNVLDSWEALRRTKNYEEVAGIKLFQKLFDQCPKAKALFGFPLDIDPYSDELLKSKRFKMHASYLIQMFDTALGMLGPDIELLTEMLEELGMKHITYGVTAEYFPFMERCLIATLEECLADVREFKFTAEMKESWEETFRALSNDMIKAQNKFSSRRSSNLF